MKLRSQRDSTAKPEPEKNHEILNKRMKPDKRKRRSNKNVEPKESKTKLNE